MNYARAAAVVLVGALYAALAIKVLAEEQIWIGFILSWLCMYALYYAWANWQGREMRFRFSLRALLIATTLSAIGLGLTVYALRK